MSGKRMRRVLVVDDEPDMAEWLALTVTGAGYDARVATRGADAEQLFTSWQPDAALVDLVLPDVNGADLVRRFKTLQPRAEVLVVSGQGSIPRAVEAIKAGATYFLEKPIDAESVLAMLGRAIERTELEAENVALRRQLLRSLPVREHHRPQPQDARAVRSGAPRWPIRKPTSSSRARTAPARS